MTDIDITKPIRTMGGCPVEIITDKGRGKYPLVGYKGDENFPENWTRDGKYRYDFAADNDIENVPERKEGFCNVYPDGQFGWSYKTKEAADNQEDCRGRIALLRLTLEGDRLVSVDIVKRFGEGRE